MTEHPLPSRRPRFIRPRAHQSTGLVLVLAVAAIPAVQAADCNGVKPWLGSTIYQPGDTLQKADVLYQARQTIWNAPPDHPAGRRYYDNLGRCEAGPPTANIPPQVRLSAPGNGSGFTAGSPITVIAEASDRDGSIGKVEFFRDALSLGSVSNAPYQVVWSSPGAGDYQLTAVATDDRGARTTSAPIKVNVTAAATDSTAPSIPDGLAATSRSPNSIALQWNAAHDNPGGSGVAAYLLYRDGRQIATVTATRFTDNGLQAATGYRYALSARDKAGNTSAVSAAISAHTLAEDNGGEPVAPIEPGDPGNSGDPGAPAASGKRVIGYFTQWGIYGRNYRVKNIDSSGSAARLTHINYAFGNVRNNRCEVGITQAADPASGAGGDAYADYTRSFGANESVSGVADQWNQPLRGNWNQLKQLKAKYPQLKTLISLGGWTWSRGFASAARPENRQAFVASCIDAYIKGNLPFTDNAGGKGVAAGVFDGIDIDWEYPAACGLGCGTPADRDNFTALLAEFRRQLDAVRPGLLLTVAVGAGIDKIRPTDPAAYHRYLDFINVMTYDFHGAWAGTTNHHSALFNSPADPSRGDAALYNSNDAIEAYLQRGVPAAKLNLGVGFYGRGWTNVARTNNGLYQSGRPAAGKYEAGIEDWKVLKNLGWPVHTDPLAQATWLYDGNTFWSVDTPEMLGRKMAYVKAQGLGGAFFWEFSGDDAQGTLVNSIGNGLK